MINKIKLSNWKTHSEISLEFKKGINILVGPMGSGKSSILQGICYAFFGFIPESKKKEIKISELIKRGSVGPATVEVDFLHKGELFKIIRTISTNKNEAIVRDKDNLLLAGTNPSQVNEFLKNHLKLDEDVFLRTVYAKQNEIDLFLQLNPQERKVRLDDLMALNKYENARKSCVKLVNLLSAKKEEKENFLKNFNISEISDEISKLKSEIENLENENKNCATEYSKNLLEKELIEKKIKELRSKFENYKKLEAEQKFLVNQINELNLKIPKEIANKEILEKNLQEHQSSLMNFEEKKREINKKLNEANNQRISLEKESSFIESKQADIELRLEQIAISELELKNLYENCGIKDIGKELENAIAEEKEINMKLASVESEIRLTKKHLDELSTAEGVCPTCLRALEKNTKEKLILARKEFIEQKVSEIENYTKLKLEIEDKIEKLQNILEQSKELVNSISKKAELENQKKTYETQIKNCQERLKNTLNQIENYKKEVEEIDNKLALIREVVSNLKEKISLAELNESKIKYEKRLEEIRILLKQKPDESNIFSSG
ncbi:MAG: AAA family ATPase, partial [Candidatus Nanoarchaeia archaeon]